MAVVLVLRPWGLFGRAQAIARHAAPADTPLRLFTRRGKLIACAVVLLLALAPLFADAFPYMPVLMVEIMIAALFAASLHFIMGPGGMHSFGHAAYFGLGAYGAAIFLKVFALPMDAALIIGLLVAGIGALVFGWFCVRLSGVYLAMLTLAFAQIVWSVVYQWDAVTGGSNGILGLWSAPWMSSSVVLLCDACVRSRGRVAVAAHAVHTARPRDARGPRFALACRGDRYRRGARAMGRVRRRCDGVRPRGIALCVLEGQHIARGDQRRAFRRWSRHGPARRHPNADRANRRSGGFHVAARYRRASD